MPLRFLLIFLIFSTYLVGCSSTKISFRKNNLKKYFRTAGEFNQGLSGFALFDPESGKMLFDFNASKYFTPASNTKLFTFYTGKKVLEDSVSSFTICTINDTLVISGMGDPTFLHPSFDYQPLLTILEDYDKPVAFVHRNFYDKRYGPGWAWDDFPYYFQPEKSSAPVHGNMIRVVKDSMDTALHVSPDFFEEFFSYRKDTSLTNEEIIIDRDEHKNIFSVRYNSLPDVVEIDIPFLTSNELVVQLLEDRLKIQVIVLDSIPKGNLCRIIKSEPVDSLMKEMLTISDNFLAEQILLMSALKQSDSLNTKIAIDYSLSHYYKDFSDEIYWRDGSGLSRYNKITPRSFIELLELIYTEYPQSYLYDLFPKGGVNGTLKRNFVAEKPYIIAKTGSMSNVYNLSGYLVTRNGKWLIFSFMNNNFTASVQDLKEAMEKILYEIHERN